MADHFPDLSESDFIVKNKLGAGDKTMTGLHINYSQYAVLL